MDAVHAFLGSQLDAPTTVDAAAGIDTAGKKRTVAGGYGSDRRISDAMYGSLANSLYNSGRLSDAQWSGVGGYNAGAQGPYNANLNGNVANLDKQITEMQKYAGTPAYDQKKLDDLKAQRGQANVGRWASVTDWSNPGMQQLKQALSSGQISWKDLGDNFDVSEVGDPAALAQHLTQFLKDKTAATAAPGATPPSAVDQAGAAAAEANKNALSSVNDYANSTLNTALNTFDQQVGQKGAAIASQSNPLARQIGGEDAGFAANQASANLAANASAQRDVTKDAALNNVNDFISSSLQKSIDEGVDLSSMDATQKLQIQQQGLKGLLTELQNSVDTTNAGAMQQLTALQSQINDFNAQQMSDQERQSRIKSIIGLAAGLALSGAGAAAAATGVGAAASPFLIGAGAGQIGRSV